jgi:hypothetical protein
MGRLLHAARTLGGDLEDKLPIRQQICTCLKNAHETRRLYLYTNTTYVWPYSLGSSRWYVGRKGVAVCEHTGTISWPRVLEPEHAGM